MVRARRAAVAARATHQERTVNTAQSIGDAAHKAQVDLHTEHRVAAIDERIFSGFLEHMGRAVYQGVFDPGSPLSDRARASGGT